MHEQFHPDFSDKKEIVRNFVARFKTDGKLLADGKRNKIKIFEDGNFAYNIKSFKVPNLVNQIIYGMIRPSKAKRSFEYANRLLENGFGTPRPVAYFENKSLLLKDSYYVSEQLQCDLTFRELTTDRNYPDHETILRQFTKFTFDLHEKNIEFLDHTPGNTLIRKIGEKQYAFFLVDLNRMNFRALSFDERLKNMARLTPEPDLVRVMADEYSKLSGHSFEETFSKLTKFSMAFRDRFYRKRRIKKMLLLRK
ncbi:lipopolysaccharide kinase InaA family protein [Flavobacterium selenitireducens]|uniref:lipopolysaccharide kinase InaA family protein n=1 Tax=Flavobacterium selenitireducens TaxID=2722704 RepID=UPI00168BE225|nr:lipopolysaccharide kinase InaA family protein [Flavobacterium selenitireducens]MBD3582616.1 Kdo domain containing protein [Flavobacterium selenitireducens]